jgi:predicted outer membrane repeat protein
LSEIGILDTIISFGRHFLMEDVMNRIWIVFLLFVLVSSVHARDFYVANDGSTDFVTIAEAITAAQTGDSVIVADGLYTGDGNRDLDYAGKNITVKSENGPSNCVIDCAAAPSEPHRAFVFQNGEGQGAILQGFTIINGIADLMQGESAQGAGGAILCIESSPVIKNCILAGNTAFNGGAIAVLGNSGPFPQDNVLIMNCTFSGNRATSQGGAIYASPASQVILANSILWENTGPFGPDLVHAEAHSFIISHCNVKEPGSEMLPPAQDEPLGAVWGQHNFDYAPGFVQSGHWEQLDTVSFNDDYYVPGDYHLMSKVGRWDPNEMAWVQDDQWSPCVDAGRIGDAIDTEFWPHGRRLNLGAYGGTRQASLSPSNLDLGDLNLDGLVNESDLDILRGELGMTGLAQGDLDRNLIVDTNDIELATMRWRPHIPLPQASPQADSDPLVWQHAPNSQMQWAVVPSYSSATEGLISMEAQTFFSTDGSSVEYKFVDANHPEVDTDWTSVLVGMPVTWTDHVPDVNVAYSYQVKARNSGNLKETQWSPVATIKLDRSELFPDPPVWLVAPSAGAAGTVHMEVKRVFDSNDAEVQYYFAHWIYDNEIEGDLSSGWTTNPKYAVSGLLDGEYRFSVRAKSDSAGETSYSSIDAATVEWTLDPDTCVWDAPPAQTTIDSVLYSAGQVTMSVQEVFDPNADPVEYYFSHWLVDDRKEGDFSRGWSSSRDYSLANLPEGDYRFSVKARSPMVGENTASEIVTVHVDRSAPEPSTTTWAFLPRVDGGSNAMAAVEATDDSDRVEYLFECHNNSAFSSGWQSSPDYVAVIGKIQRYVYRVKARDLFGNETGWSDWAQAF